MCHQGHLFLKSPHFACRSRPAKSEFRLPPPTFSNEGRACAVFVAGPAQSCRCHPQQRLAEQPVVKWNACGKNLHFPEPSQLMLVSLWLPLQKADFHHCMCSEIQCRPPGETRSRLGGGLDIKYTDYHLSVPLTMQFTAYALELQVCEKRAN